MSGKPHRGGKSIVPKPSSADQVAQLLDEINAALLADTAGEATPDATDLREGGSEDEGSPVSSQDSTTQPDIVNEPHTSHPAVNIGMADLRQTPRNGITTPIPEGVSISQVQMDLRITAMRVRIGPLAGVTDEALHRILVEVRWDLDDAIVRWEANRAGARARTMINLQGREPERVVSDEFLSVNNRYQNHRRAVNELVERLSQSNTDPRHQLSALRAGNLLRENRWDIQEAVTRHIERVFNAEDMYVVERNERRLRIANPSQAHQDERLAIFLELAGTDDWISARHFLRLRQWDIGVAVDDMMKGGMPTVAPSVDEQKRAGFFKPVLPHGEHYSLWNSERADPGPTPTGDAADVADVSQTYGQGSLARRRGWLVDADRTPAVPGIHVPEKGRYFAISHGLGKLYDFEGVSAVRTGRRGEGVEGGKVNFNWFDAHHIGVLNKWRVQIPRRLEDTHKKDSQQPYLQEELDWILEWHRQTYEEMVGDRAFDDGTFPLNFDVKSFASDFNNTFADRTDMAGTESRPRPTRTLPALNAHRLRIRAVCEDFNLPFTPSRPPKPQAPKGHKKRAQSPEEDDSEEGEGSPPFRAPPDESDQEASKRSAKRPRRDRK